MKALTYGLLSLVMVLAFLLVFTNVRQSPPQGMIDAYEVKYDSLREMGYGMYPAHIIAGFECDIYDESDSVEYAEYVALMED